MTEWYYISFAKPGEFLGGCYVRPVVDDPELEAALMLDAAEVRGDGSTLDEDGLQRMLALVSAKRLGINPGGEAKIWGPIPIEHLDEWVPKKKRERLLTREEVESE